MQRDVLQLNMLNNNMLMVLKMFNNVCVSQPGQGQHEDDYTDKARQQSGSSTTPFEETIRDDYLKSYSELHIPVLKFSGQLTANKISALHDCLLLSGCLLSLLSCPDKNKHGKKSTLNGFRYFYILTFLHI